MGNRANCAFSKLFANGLLDKLVGLKIDRGCCFVEHQDLRSSEQRSGQADQLTTSNLCNNRLIINHKPIFHQENLNETFAYAQVFASFVNLMVQTRFLGSNERFQVSLFERFPDFLIGVRLVRIQIEANCSCENRMKRDRCG